MRSKFLVFIFSLAFILNIPTGLKAYASDLMLNQSKAPSINHPFAAFENYRNRMLEMFQDFDSEFSGDMGFSSFNPDINIETTDHEYIVVIDLPGSDEEKINVELKNNQLSISGQREVLKENQNSNGFHSSKRSFASFHKSVTLPNDASEDDLKANYENEVLKITIGRLREKRSNNENINEGQINTYEELEGEWL